MTTTPTHQFAALNDRFRRGGPQFGIPGRTFVTAGVAALSGEAKQRIFDKVTRFDQFTEENDPHGT